MADLHKAIRTLYPEVVTISEDDVITALDNNNNPVVIDMDAVNNWVDPELYKQQRVAEYPPLSEQLDYIYHNGVEAWKTDMIQPVKDKYPKPE